MISTSKATSDGSDLIFLKNGLCCLSLGFLFYFPLYHFVSSRCYTTGQCPYCLVLYFDSTGGQKWFCQPIDHTLMLLNVFHSPLLFSKHMARLENPSWLLLSWENYSKDLLEQTTCLDWYPWHVNVKTFHTLSDFATWVTKFCCKNLNKYYH